MSITKDDCQHLVGGRYKHTALLLRTLEALPGQSACQRHNTAYSDKTKQSSASWVIAMLVIVGIYYGIYTIETVFADLGSPQPGHQLRNTDIVCTC